MKTSGKKSYFRKNTFKKRKVKFRKEVLFKEKTSKNIKIVTAPISKSFFRAKIKIFGIGGGGRAIVSEIGRSLGKTTFVIADTDTRSFKRLKGIKFLSFGQNLTRGLGTGLNTNLAKLAAEQVKKRLTDLFKGQDIIIFIVSLGGGTGSGATQVFIEQIPKDFTGIAFGIFTLPFKFEGKQKNRIASKALSELVKSLNVSLVIPNERIFKVIDPKTSITKAFSIVNKTIIENLNGLINLIYNPGVINIDFADLRTILQGKGNLAFLNTVEAAGRDRLEKITRNILNNSLYRNNSIKPERVLFNIQGGSDLSIFEIDKISRTIAELNPKAKIIFGISRSPNYKNRIKATLLMTSPSVGSQVNVVKKPSVKPVDLRIKKIKKTKKSKKSKKQLLISKPKEIQFFDELEPVLNKVPADLTPQKLNIVETSGLESEAVKKTTFLSGQQKKTIRRTALEVKRAQEKEEKKKLKQEREWEIPAFLRRFKFRP